MSSPLLRIFPQAAPSLGPHLHPLLGGQQSCTAAIHRFPARRPAHPPELSSRPRHRRHLVFSYCRSTHLHRAREMSGDLGERATKMNKTGRWRRVRLQESLPENGGEISFALIVPKNCGTRGGEFFLSRWSMVSRY
jgi:hypothetical protein